MDRVAVFVDSGYLFAEGSRALSGRKLQRGEINLDYDGVICSLKAFSEQVSQLPLLRIYWYDGTSQGPSTQHIALAEKGYMKVRLGFVNSYGQQKGVDSLVVTDMITLARNGAMAECVLLSGDEDIRVGVQQAQEYGARVHLLGIKPARSSQSQFLRQEADSLHEWESDDLSVFLECQPRASIQPEGQREAPIVGSHVPMNIPSSLREVAQMIAGEIPHSDIEALIDQIESTGQRPYEIDARLLRMSQSALKHDLDSREKESVRGEFLSALQDRNTERNESVL